jgi:membrane protease YdiL (CAAX protease family)
MEQSNMSGLKENKKRGIYYLALYIIFFFAAWTFKEGFLNKSLESIFSDNVNMQYLVSAGIKLLIWVVPVFVYLKLVNRESPLSYLKMNRNAAKGIFWGIVICVSYIGFSLLRDYIMGDKRVNLDLNLNQWLNIIIMAGFAEEIVFRGFLLQKFEEYFEFFWSNIITSVLFIFIHFPKWYFTEGEILPQSMLSVFILGIAFGYTYKKTGSIWTSMIFHSTNNFIVLAIVQ